jgi:hypothetical protein
MYPQHNENMSMGFVGAGGAGNVLKLVVMVLQRGEVTKNH